MVHLARMLVRAGSGHDVASEIGNGVILYVVAFRRSWQAIESMQKK